MKNIVTPIRTGRLHTSRNSKRCLTQVQRNLHHVYTPEDYRHLIKAAFSLYSHHLLALLVIAQTKLTHCSNFRPGDRLCHVRYCALSAGVHDATTNDKGDDDNISKKQVSVPPTKATDYFSSFEQWLRRPQLNGQICVTILFVLNFWAKFHRRCPSPVSDR